VNENPEQLEQAKTLSGESTNWLDRRKWLFIPTVTF
jgi:hypothetical protein